MKPLKIKQSYADELLEIASSAYTGRIREGLVGIILERPQSSIELHFTQTDFEFDCVFGLIAVGSVHMNVYIPVLP